MFKYSEKDLYDRCGYDKNSFSLGTIKPTDKFYTMSDGTKIPIIQRVNENDGLSRHLVLKTFKGYICVDNITNFTDIFDDSKYLKDETQWISPYLLYKYEFYNKSIARLANVLGKHWNGEEYNISENNDSEEIVRKRILTK